MFEAIKSAIQGMIYRAVVKRVTPEKMQKLQVLGCGQTDEAEHFEPYGFTSRPKAGAEAIVLEIGGTGHPIVICAADRRYRVSSSEEGEVCIYDDEGRHIWLRRDGIYIEGKEKVQIDSPVRINSQMAASSGAFDDGASTIMVVFDQGLGLNRQIAINSGIITSVQP